jgi:hypothetical protein
MKCVNLKERFGHRYRITFDPAYNPKHVPRDKLDAWMMLIPCRRGVIYLYGGDRLAIEVEGRAPTRNLLHGLGCTTTCQEGDNFLSVTFDVSDFDDVARVVQPRKRRRLTEQQKQEAVERLAGYQFGSQSRTSERSQRPVTHPEASA